MFVAEALYELRLLDTDDPGDNLAAELVESLGLTGVGGPELFLEDREEDDLIVGGLVLLASSPLPDEDSGPALDLDDELDLSEDCLLSTFPPFLLVSDFADLFKLSLADFL